MKEKFSTEDLTKALGYLKSYISSSDNIHTYEKSPIYKLLHEEILRYTKEEIDGSIDALNDGTNLYNISFQIRNPYIFSAFLKIGAFNHRLSEESKWLLNQVKNPSNDLYELAFIVQDGKQKRLSYKEGDSNNPSHNDVLFNCLFDSYTNEFYKLDTPEKIEVIDKYLTQFGKEKEENLIYFVSKNYHNESPRLELCEYIITKLVKNGLDVSTSNCLNHLLPKQSNIWNNRNFSIHEKELSAIKNLLDYGFRFNEKEYSFFDDSLFIAAIKSRNPPIIKTILPYLSDITPKIGTIEEQDQFVNDFIKTVGDNIGKLIEATYLGISLKNDNDNKNGDKKKLKL